MQASAAPAPAAQTPAVQAPAVRRPAVLTVSTALALGLTLTLALVSGRVAEATTVLLIPDSGNDKVWAFSAIDGAIVSDNFIPSDGNMVQPICAIESGRGTILVSDEIADAIFEYSYNGVFLGRVVEAADGLEAPFGIAIRDGLLYITSPPQKRVWRSTVDGTELTVWWNGTDTNSTPRDIVFRSDDALVADSSKDAIERIDLAGTYLGLLVDSDGINGIDFPSQLQVVDGEGGVLAAGFSPPIGLYRYDSGGRQIFVANNLVTPPRGTALLGTGEYIYSGGTRVMAYDPVTLTERVIVNNPGSNFRFIEAATLTAPCAGDVNGDGVVDGVDLALLLGGWATPTGDLDGDGVVNGSDLAVLLGAWGPC